MKPINKFILFFICFMSFYVLALAQNKEIDSLKNRLEIHKENDTLQINLLNELAFKYYKKDVKVAKTYLNQAETVLKTIDYKKGEARLLYIKGSLLLEQGDLQAGIDYFKDALQLYKSANFKEGILDCYTLLVTVSSQNKDYAKSIDYLEKAIKLKEEIGVQKDRPDDFNNLGFLNLKLGNYSRSLQHYKDALKLYEVQDNKDMISSCYASIGDLYKRQGNYPLALDYLNKALFIKEKYGDSAGDLYSILNTIGVIYEREGFPDKSLEYYNRALKINIKNKNKSGICRTNIGIGTLYISKKEYDRAYTFLNRALEVSEEINDLEMVAVTLNYIGYIYLSQEKLNSAFDCYSKSEAISLKTGNQSTLSKAYRGLGNIFLSKKKYKEALSYALKSKVIADKLNSLSHQINAEYLLFDVYKNIGNYKKALASHEAYKRVSDSLFNKENIEKITQLEYEYKYKQALDSAHIKELSLTKTLTATNKDLEKSKQNYLWAIIGFLLVSILLGSIIFYQKFKNIQTKNKNIVIEQRLLLSQMTPHFIFNSLSVLQGMILNKEAKKSVSFLSKFSKLLRTTLENSRDKMVSLSQELEAVKNYLSLQNLENQNYNFNVFIADNIDVSRIMMPPMLIQPFVENALEHAFKNPKTDKRIDVKLSYINKELICTIEDNGIGINQQDDITEKDKKSLATTITSERLKLLSKHFKMRGSIKIEDRKKYNQQGTIVTIVIPHKIF
ncbi:tetratricopeptide repeat protein [Olleya sp. YS]|uniref:tetratricopeptide repeat-containing sensor histidine kinase n=1 Tax=Olleya sp. YS TaxID=3028318 RepID=UPI0024342B09|nr:tetratricopeptide repeat protein [Olleya sp. YS]WGD34539.1 tetratricopeptide repeat protein [Olleya sp. YS]